VEPDTFLTKLIGPEAPKTYQKVMGNYILLRDARNWLREIALIGTHTIRIRYTMRSVSAQVNELGQLEFNIDPMIKALENVEVSKIRTCQICRKIFWAPRRDSLCCSIRCGWAERSRRHRKKYPVQYKLQRYERAQVSSELESKARLAKEALEREELESLRAPDFSNKRRTARLPQGNDPDILDQEAERRD
jgi:hypothetical protein